MKKTAIFLLVFVILFSSAAFFAGAESSAPSRQIHVVFDDSGSMIRNPRTKEPVDTWCQAKYAMEVFAAMLESNDTMNIYAMSDFEYTEQAKPRLHLDGKSGMSTNVAKVHNMVTHDMNTPFASVRKAYNDLAGAKADEKWLVVLTDGEFQKVNGDINNYFAKKSDKVNVVFLGMGKEAEKNHVVSDESRHIYAIYAKTSTEILTKITDICTRVFNSQRLNVNAATKKISFDVPMGELTVFAQGANVKINGIIKENGQIVKSSSEPVTVKHSETATTSKEYPKIIVDRDLLGSIATFIGDFDPGSYTLDVTGAETIEVYYKPNIAIAAYLTDSNGNRVPDLTDLEAGEYTVNFGLVKGGTNEPVKSSSLLGVIEYNAIVTNDGKKHDKVYHNGDKITLVEGDLTIDAVAKYLEYNTTSTTIRNMIFKNKELTFSPVSDPTYSVNSDGFADPVPMEIEVKFDGKEITDEQWEKMELPQVKMVKKSEFKVDDFIVEKTDQKGVFRITPVLKDGKPSSGTYADFDVEVSYEGTSGAEKWSGQSTVTVKMTDNRSWLERNRGRIIRALIALVIAIIVLGYTPVFKHYLPRGLKSAPTIMCDPDDPSADSKKRSGKYKKNFLTTIIPYKAETGTIMFVPANVPGVADLKIKGSKKRRMKITNLDAYRGDADIRFNSKPIEKQKELDSGAGLKIIVTKKETTFTCVTNK